jgi:small subunit ribosomal protein S7
MRRPVKKRKETPTEERYQSETLARFTNTVMWDGKKNAARAIVYGALEEIKKRDPAADPIAIFDMAIQNVAPTVEVRSRRVGGANYQVPREVRPERRRALAFRWIISAARSGKGRPMAIKLADELIAASKNEGSAFKKKEEVHRMAEANRAFAHFAW